MNVLPAWATTESEFLARADIQRTVPAERLAAFLIPLFRMLVWRKLPAERRRRFVARILEALAPLPGGSVPVHPITICGYLGSPTGLGEAARLNAEALHRLGYDVRLIDISRFMFAEMGQHRTAPKLLEKGPGTLLLHFNPEVLSVVLPLIGQARIAGKRVIGYWAWELPAIPQSWVNSLRFVDEVWAPSRFAADAISAATAKPVRVVPHPVASRRPGVRRRQDFAFPEQRFTVLCMFSFASSIERKNPLGAIAAFRRAFGDSGDVELIIKSSDGAKFPLAFAQLREAIGMAPNIRLIEADLDREMVADLIASVDAVLSLHRAEGFGLVLAEAMHAGIPVVATAWSGNLDFMDTSSAALLPSSQVPSYDSAHFYWLRGQSWAEPDIDAAAAWLRRLAGAPQERAALGRSGQARVGELLGLDAFGRAVAESIGAPVTRFDTDAIRIELAGAAMPEVA